MTKIKLSKKIKVATSAAVEEVIKNPERVAMLATIEENPAELLDAARLAKEFKENLNKKLQNEAAQEKRKMTDGSLMGGVTGDYRPKGSTETGEFKASSLITFLFFWAVIVQGADILSQTLLGISRLATLNIFIILYLTVATLACIAYWSNHIKEDIKNAILFFSLSTAYIILPFVLGRLPNTNIGGGLSLLDWASFFLAFFPAWPLYVAHHSGSIKLEKFADIWRNVIIFFMLFLAIFYFTTNLNAASLAAVTGTPQTLQVANVLDFFMEKTVQVGKNIWKNLSFSNNIKNLLNATGIGYYTGMVDQNEKEPVGLYITNIRSQDRVSYIGTPAVVWADIEGKSFTEAMKITPFCYTEGTGNKRIEGTPSPASLEIFGEEHDSIRCTYEDLTKGTYKAVTGAGFNFETWAYVTYTFVDLELARSMAVEGKNINSELDIPKSTKAVYSNGPIMLGMGASVDQPVGVDKVRNDRDPIIGVTLANKWTDGHLERVNEFILQVPDDFDLVDCDRGKDPAKPTPFETREGYNYFKFTREDLADPRIEFISLTCRLHIKDATHFLSGQQKVQRTFATQVKYDYYIQKSTSVSVKE